MKFVFPKCAVFVLLALVSIQVSAGLLINPKRIVLEERQRGAALDLLNDGVSLARYQIFFEQKVMRPDGSIVNLETLDPDAVYAKDIVRYSPRRVDIEPGSRQTIRIAARRPKDLPEGEYISHLVFQEIPVLASANGEDLKQGEEDKDDDLVSVSVTPRLKIAIPIVIRKGALNATASISSVAFDATAGKHGAFTLNIEREGASSLYGSVEVFDYENAQVGERLAVSKGVGVYTGVSKRYLQVRLAQPLKPGLKEFLIRFDEDEKYGGSNLVEVPFTLQQ